MKQLVWITAVSLATITAVLLLWVFRTALVLFVLSLMVSAVIRPIVDRLSALGLPRSLALIATYLVNITLGVVLGLALGGPFITELQAMAHDLPIGYEQLKTQWLGGTLFQQAIAKNILDFNNLFQTVTGGQWNVIIQKFMGVTFGSLDLISKLIIVFVLSIYWSADQEHFKRLWLSQFHAESRTRARDIWQNIEREIGSYLRSELIQSLLAVVFLGIGYQLIGLKYPVLLALIGAVGWLIIWIGGLLAVIPALLVGLSISPVIGLVAAVFSIVVLAFLEFLVEPRLFDRRRLSSLLVVVIVLILVKQYGMFGFFMGPPLAASIQIFARHLIHPAAAPTIELAPPPTIQIELLRKRLFSVQEMITTRPEPPPPEILNLIDRLDGLIDRANHEHQLAE